MQSDRHSGLIWVPASADQLSWASKTANKPQFTSNSNIGHTRSTMLDGCHFNKFSHISTTVPYKSGSVADWLTCWTQARKARVQIAVATLSGNSLRQTVRTHLAYVHLAAKLVAALLRVARVTVGLAESNGSLPPGL